MKLENLSIDQAVGAVLIHNIAGADGRRALAKGRLLRAEDIATLRALGKQTVYAAVLEPGDVREDDAAAALAQSAAGKGIEASKPSGGRVNFYSTLNGLLTINSATLARLNELRGVTLATIAAHSVIAPKKMVATLKTIGLALPQSTLDQGAAIVRDAGPALQVATMVNRKVALVLTGSEVARGRVQQVFSPPIRARVEELGGEIIQEDHVLEEATDIGQALQKAIRGGAQLVILAGETSIMDVDDITPRGILRAGGEIELYGAPVEPGNLLLLAYCGQVPVVGAPGCVKSRETNVVDLILPRLMAGERINRSEVNALAAGGLLIGSS